MEIQREKRKLALFLTTKEQLVLDLKKFISVSNYCGIYTSWDIFKRMM